VKRVLCFFGFEVLVAMDMKMASTIRNFLPAAQGVVFSKPITEMSAGNIKQIMFLGSKVRPVRGADSLTAIYEPIVQIMWDT
jgi:hypothetical protein